MHLFAATSFNQKPRLLSHRDACQGTSNQNWKEYPRCT